MKNNKSGYEVGIRLLLLRDYICANAGKHRAVKLKQMLDYLSEVGHPIERKTLYNDLNTLATEFGLDWEYERKKRGYILHNPPFEPHELRLIVDSIQASKFLTRETAKTLTGKIKKLAGKDTAETLNRQSYVADRVRNMNESVVKDSDRLHQAIAEDRKIGFRYFHYTPSKERNYTKDGDQFIVSPYALYWNNGNYYLYAYDGKRFRYFRVDRMERISFPLLEPREGKEEFQEKNLTHQKAKVFDMYGGKEYTVRIRFRNELAGAVVDQFGKDVLMIPTDAEHFTISVPVEISPTFFAWIATFGRRVKILGPEPVVEKMKEFIGKVSDMYKEK